MGWTARPRHSPGASPTQSQGWGWRTGPQGVGRGEQVSQPPPQVPCPIPELARVTQQGADESAL